MLAVNCSVRTPSMQGLHWRMFSVSDSAAAVLIRPD